jgi:DegV family protein with EDD domain
MGIQIVTDSTTEISQSEAKELGIAVVPLKSLFGEKEYLDGIDMTPEEFYIKLAQAKELPTTSQPTPFDFEQVFRRAQEAGDQVVTLTLPADLSGTYQSACIARESCGEEGIWVIDSETATIGLQLLVKRAIGLRDAGKTAAEIVETIEAEKESIHLFAAIDTLEYLHKGGRLSRSSAIAGTVLKVKPLISLGQGEVKVIGKSRGMKKAYDELFQLVEQAGGIDFSKPFGIGYTGDRDRFDQFELVCQQHFGENEPIVGNIGSVIGTHAGPGAVAITFFARD